MASERSICVHITPEVEILPQVSTLSMTNPPLYNRLYFNCCNAYNLSAMARDKYPRGIYLETKNSVRRVRMKRDSVHRAYECKERSLEIGD